MSCAAAEVALALSVAATREEDDDYEEVRSGSEEPLPRAAAAEPRFAHMTFNSGKPLSTGVAFWPRIGAQE